MLEDRSEELRQRRGAHWPMLGVTMNATSEKARTLLGWNPRPVADSVTATGESILRLGLVT